MSAEPLAKDSKSRKVGAGKKIKDASNWVKKEGEDRGMQKGGGARGRRGGGEDGMTG
jgi:hypothetical protein